MGLAASGTTPSRPASEVATEINADYEGFGVVVLKFAFVALMGLAVCMAATGVIIAVALGFRGISSRSHQHGH
jgi:hypothetical protein